MAAHSVSVTLAGHTYDLRFRARSARLATAGLQNTMPNRAEKVTVGDAAGLVYRQDLDAVLVFLWQGLLPSIPNLTIQKVEGWFDREIDAGRPVSDYSLPILEALKQGHLIDLNYRSTVDDDAVDEPEAEVPSHDDPLARRALYATRASDKSTE